MKQSGIYKLTAPNGKAYVGQSINLERRMEQYSSGQGHARIGNAIKRFGFAKFKVEYLHVVTKQMPYNALKERLTQLEIKAIKKHNTLFPNGLNCVMPCVNESWFLKSLKFIWQIVKNAIAFV
jgi:group I intron endonuclease